MSIVLLFLLLLMSGKLYAYARQQHYVKLQERSRELLEDPDVAATMSLFKDPRTAAELSAYAGVTAAEFLWTWSSIDPEVIRAAAFSSGEPIGSGYQFAQYIHFHYDSLAPAAKEGAYNRLLGYVGEQHVASLLASQGHHVQYADSATQPVWDALIDGHQVNVKTVADVASIKGEAMAHSDTTYLVPEDAHGHVANNVAHLSGFHHADLSHSLHDSIASAHGEAASHAMGMHIPWISFGFAAHRNYQAVKLGKDPGAAVQHTVVDGIGRGGGAVVGGKVGAVLGAVGGPVGAVLGAIVGGVFGATIGGMGADRVKALPLQSALADLESRLTTFGQSFETKFRSISEYMMTPVYRAEASLKKLTDTVEERRNTWRFRLWPDFYTVLLEESIRTGQKKLAELRAQARVITRILESAEKGDPRAFAKVGVMMANTAAIRDLVDYDAQLLEAVEQARAKVRHERKQLDPGRFPSS